jgi:phospholipase/carboxylesterase
MLHGWTGDENSMWLFTRNIPQHYAILLPRAPFPIPEGGYSWREIAPRVWSLPSLDEFRSQAEILLALIDRWISIYDLDSNNFDIAGFSQGAAMAFSLALYFPARVNRVAALSGFLPEGCESQLPVLEGKQVFMAHGRADELIPIERARRADTLLKDAGALVTYCESDGGHKVGKECLREMEKSFIIG